MDDFGAVAPYLAIWIFCAVLGAGLGSSRALGTQGGCLLGLLLGPIGLIIVAVSGARSKLEQLETRPDTEGWHPDPLGRFDSRWWDGRRWTQHVGRIETDGTRRQLEDPL